MDIYFDLNLISPTSKMLQLLLKRMHHIVPDLRIDKELNVHETLSTIHHHAIDNMRIGSEYSYISVSEIAGVIAGSAIIPEMCRLESIESAVRYQIIHRGQGKEGYSEYECN